MARLIGGTNSSNYGEKTFVSKACEYLDNNHIIYWNRQLYGREFDVCILMPEKGILVVELKGWREENILRVENNEYVVIQTTDGEITSSPQKQARGYRFSLERHLRQSIDKFPLVCQLVCLPQVSKAFYHTHRLDVVMEEKFTMTKLNTCTTLRCQISLILTFRNLICLRFVLGFVQEDGERRPTNMNK